MNESSSLILFVSNPNALLQTIPYRLIRTLSLMILGLSLLGCQTMIGKTVIGTTQHQYLIQWAPVNEAPHLKSFSHVVEFQGPEQTLTLIVQGEINDSTLIMVATNEIGVPLFEISLKEQVFDYKELVPLTHQISPWNLLETLQLHFVNDSILKKIIIPNCHLTATRIERNLICNGHPNIKIKYNFEKDHLKSVKYQSENSSWRIITTLH